EVRLTLREVEDIERVGRAALVTAPERVPVVDDPKVVPAIGLVLDRREIVGAGGSKALVELRERLPIGREVPLSHRADRLKPGHAIAEEIGLGLGRRDRQRLVADSEESVIAEREHRRYQARVLDVAGLPPRENRIS